MESSEGDGPDLVPAMMTSLVISPAKAVSGPSQALSPIRKHGSPQERQEGYEQAGVCEGGSGHTQELHVHSAAVVKSSEVEFPVQFHELQSNTDLKMPPPNWLQDHSSVRLPNPTHRPADFSSFFMAHQFPDCVGEVDVVSTAENIKKLLKIPYNPKAHVSMMIHRVGKTLLVDDFDIYKYLLRQSEKEWQWLRKFFFEHILESLAHKENVLVRPNKSRHMVQSRSLLSKFLYHSINEEDTHSPSPSPPAPHQPLTHTPISVCRPSAVVSEGMPEPSLEEQLPHTASQAFTRNVVWNFEDLHMLIGTDLPIFGGGTHPCVSLRLHDMNKPINILTGIDYWLDNLMCNVPEVVMCYHLDGIVQKYQLIKTEDLPHTAEYQFSPRLVRDVAQNILAFLNSKATKEGHTYWLFKGKDDDIVKLYDLTSLCAEGRVRVDGSEEEESQGPSQGSHQDASGNPFTVPVAMLFYRVAKNMRASQDAHSKVPSIRALLTNALSLLDNDQYPKIVSSAHYMLSDLYVPQDVDPDSPALSDCSDDDSEWSSVLGNSDDEEEDQEREEEEINEKTRRSSHHSPARAFSSVTTAPNNSSSSSSSIKVATLCKSQTTRTQPHYYKAPPLLGSLEERCLSALSHVTQALRCLHSSTDTHCHTAPASTSPSARDQEEPKMARPFQPIPMPYSPLHQDPQDSKMAVVVSQQQRREQLTVSVLNHQYSVASWWDKLHVLLLRKASLIYLVMARTNFTANKYGMSLQYLRFSLHAWQGMTCRLGVGTGCLPAPAQALTLAGDVFYMMAQHWQETPTHVDAYNTVATLHQEMLALLDNIIPSQECSGVIKLPCDVEEALSLSSTSLEAAISTTDPETAIMLSRRLGNVCNELGVMYMNQAAKLCEESEVGFKGAEELWRRSDDFLRRGLESFTRAQDSPNMALLHSNSGRLLRLCAFYSSSRDTRGARQSVNTERRYYEQALREYQRALEVLVSRGRGAEIWDLVVWEYSTTLYTVASVLQDRAPHANIGGGGVSGVVPREVVDLLNKSLKHCDVTTPGPRQPLYQYRAAVIYMRLAGIFHNALRHGYGESKNMRHLAEVNYKKAAGLFLLLENPIDIVKVQLDRVVLVEDQIQGVSSPQTLYRLHLSILHLLVECLPALKLAQPVPASTISHKANPCQHKPQSGEAGVNTKKKQDNARVACGEASQTDIKAGHSDKQDGECCPTVMTSTTETTSGHAPTTTSSLSIGSTTEAEKGPASFPASIPTSTSEEEEGQARSEEMLEVFEKKLQGSLMALIKVARKGSAASEVAGTLKQMYSLSLNVRSLPLPSHLLAATTTITSLLKTLPQRR